MCIVYNVHCTLYIFVHCTLYIIIHCTCVYCTHSTINILYNVHADICMNILHNIVLGNGSTTFDRTRKLGIRSSF